MKSGNKKDKVFYYVGWGIAYGTFAGGIFSVLLPEHLLVVLFRHPRIFSRWRNRITRMWRSVRCLILS